MSVALPAVVTVVALGVLALLRSPNEDRRGPLLGDPLSQKRLPLQLRRGDEVRLPVDALTALAEAPIAATSARVTVYEAGPTILRGAVMAFGVGGADVLVPPQRPAIIVSAPIGSVTELRRAASEVWERR